MNANRSDIVISGEEKAKYKREGTTGKNRNRRMAKEMRQDEGIDDD